MSAVVAAARQAPPPAGMGARVIAIDGPGGAGKTTLATLVAEHGATIVHTDDYATDANPHEWWPQMRDESSRASGTST